MSQKLVDYLHEIAKKNKTFDDDGEGDFNPMDASGGNFDDAWQMGEEDGRIDLAREILARLETGELSL